MTKIREPKNLSAFTTANRAADGLEAMARMIRQHGDSRRMVRWSINFGFWSPAWTEPGFTGGHIVRSASFHNTPATHEPAQEG